MAQSHFILLQYEVRVVPVETIHSPAFVVPKYQRRSGSPVLGQPRANDNFWLVPRKFTDRAGWEDVVYTNFPTVEDIASTSAGPPPHQRRRTDGDTEYDSSNAESFDEED